MHDKVIEYLIESFLFANSQDFWCSYLISNLISIVAHNHLNKLASLLFIRLSLVLIKS